MFITDGELAGLATIGGGGRLPGVPIVISGIEQARLALVGLRDKGVVDQHGRPTELGMAPITAVEQYGEADHHVYINQLRVSCNDDGLVTVLCQARDGWMLEWMNPWALMVGLLKAFPVLCGGGPTTIPRRPMALSARIWAETRPADGPSPVLVRDTCLSEQSTTTIAYDIRDGMGFAFDVPHEQGWWLPAWEIRARVADQIGCAPGQE
jgi:hypothetical protein